ncbi:hypothetical protein FACS1894122_04970 [Alphaproteobacteria bacterium]|nr:hypothetical protein FACS1894122_04970 [Alphaproteobacteria bacterium]
MALNQYGNMATSTNDGISWTKATAIPNGSHWGGLAYSDNKWMALHLYGKVATLTND